jgi:hypothetical protein
VGKRDQFVHRVYTVSELEEARACVVCERPATLLRPADFGKGAATVYLARKLPPLRVCDRCAGEQGDAMRVGRHAATLAYVLPAVLVLLAVLVAPFRTPIVIPTLGFAALLLSRGVIEIVRRRRTQRSRVLFVDGEGDEVMLQIRLDESADVIVPYREESRATRTDGLVVSPVGPGVGHELAFVGSTFAVSVLAVFGFVASYPVLMIDNPGPDVRVSVDGEPAVIGNASRGFRVAYGNHRVVIDDREQSVRVPWGENVLVSTSPEQCYEVRSPSERESPIVEGPILRYGRNVDVSRARCKGR